MPPRKYGSEAASFYLAGFRNSLRVYLRSTGEVGFVAAFHIRDNEQSLHATCKACFRNVGGDERSRRVGDGPETTSLVLLLLECLHNKASHKEER